MPQQFHVYSSVLCITQTYVLCCVGQYVYSHLKHSSNNLLKGAPPLLPLQTGNNLIVSSGRDGTLQMYSCSYSAGNIFLQKDVLLN